MDIARHMYRIKNVDAQEQHNRLRTRSTHSCSATKLCDHPVATLFIGYNRYRKSRADAGSRTSSCTVGSCNELTAYILRLKQ